MAASSWWVSSGGQSTTRLIPTSSTDHRDGAISSILTFLLLFPVFLLLYCVLFLMVLFWWAASRLHREPSATNIQEHHPLPLQSTMRYAYLWFFLFCVLFTIFSLRHSLRTLDTNNTSDSRSIYMMNRKRAPRHALCPAMMSALPLLYRLLFLLYHKSDLALLRVWWSFPFSLHLQHVSQLPQDFVKSSIISLLSQNY